MTEIKKNYYYLIDERILVVHCCCFQVFLVNNSFIVIHLDCIFLKFEMKPSELSLNDNDSFYCFFKIINDRHIEKGNG